MKRVAIIGSGGAGKSTVARRLGEITGIEVIHLDALFWRPGWVETPRDEWHATVRALTERPAWIMDGNYGGTLDLRLAAADTMIFLDLPRSVCLWSVVQRRLRFAGRSRPDMGPAARSDCRSSSSAGLGTTHALAAPASFACSPSTPATPPSSACAAAPTCAGSYLTQRRKDAKGGRMTDEWRCIRPVTRPSHAYLVLPLRLCAFA